MPILILNKAWSVKWLLVPGLGTLHKKVTLPSARISETLITRDQVSHSLYKKPTQN